MVDHAPLLPHYNSSEGQDGISQKPRPASVDDALESYVGENSSRQLLQAFLISFAWVFDAQQTFINVFTDAEPSWHCTGAGYDSSCSSSSSPCGLRPGSWAWDLPAHATVVSDWNLQCSGSAVVGLPATAYFTGCLVGGFLLATLADSALGRKNMLVLSCLATSLSAGLTVASPNLWAYSALRFLSGCARATVGTSALVLSTEIVGKRWRQRISIANFFFFTLGFLSLPAMAYINREESWRTLYFWTSIPCFFYSALIYFLVSESPRWLLVRGRLDEAIQILRSLSSINGNSINSSIILAEDTGHINIFSAIEVLWGKRWAFRRLMATMMVGLGIGLVYYGMPLNVGNLGSNLYLSVTLNALSELPSSLATWFIVSKLNRRCSVLILTTVSGVFSVLCVVVADNMWRMAAEVASFFCACTVFDLLLIYSIELFPTCVRNSAISMVRQAVVLGGVVAPVLVAEGRKRSFVSFGVFGLMIGCCGLFTACLPETRGRSMSDTMEEEECKLVSENLIKTGANVSATVLLGAKHSNRRYSCGRALTRLDIPSSRQRSPTFVRASLQRCLQALLSLFRDFLPPSSGTLSSTSSSPAASIPSISMELVIGPEKHQPFGDDGTILSNHLHNFKHAAVSLTLLIYAAFAVVFDRVKAQLRDEMTMLLGAAAFAQQLLVFHLHSADHMGVSPCGRRSLSGRWRRCGRCRGGRCATRRRQKGGERRRRRRSEGRREGCRVLIVL
ncbi:organic cation/carnitine transporter 2-like [Canna indica]|uniref:H(+)/Pi cotransporter n=1 Tax=Canna indica TaxID=4628 RepID=A0AAQ3KQ69_9LILI|nr:organic cation/carnitine transporter 2-like [Canna indica]